MADRCQWCDRLGTDARPIIPNRGRKLCGTCSWAEIDDVGIDITEVPAPGAIPRVRTIGGRQSRDENGVRYINPRSRAR
jgi:hypothetical protein